MGLAEAYALARTSRRSCGLFRRRCRRAAGNTSEKHREANDTSLRVEGDATQPAAGLG